MRVRLLVLASGLLVSCGPPKEKVKACEAALGARLAAIQASAASLDSAESEGDARIEAAGKSLKAATKRVEKLTIPYKTVLSYPDRLKERIAAGKMRFISATPIRAETSTGFKTIRYDVEFAGDYRALAKTLGSLYGQPAAVFVDRVEVNISDERLRQATVKAQLFVYETPKLATEVPVTGPSSAWTAAVAKGAPAECAGVKSRLASEVEAARTALEARSAAAERAGVVEAHESSAKARTTIADDLVRKRDDNKAAFTSHADELVQKALKSVAGLAEMRLKENGDPDWR